MTPSEINLDHALRDRVHLESLPGAVDVLLQQCHDLGGPALTGIRRTGDSVVLDLAGDLRAVAALRSFSALAVVLGTHQENRQSGSEEAISALRRSREDGVLSALAPGAPEALTFRVDPVADRWELRDRIEQDLGWRNDPSAWQVNLTRRDNLLLGQVGPLYHSKRFPSMDRIPASTTPLVATVMISLLKARPGDVVYDPFCGAGTLLVEAAATVEDLVLLGTDRAPRSLAAAAANRAQFGSAGYLARADATALPIPTGSVDRLVSNMPFGKRVGSHADNIRLYPAFLAELDRVLRTDGRAVLLTEDKQLFLRSLESTRNVRLVREVPLSSGGLHPSVYVVERTRTARRSKARRSDQVRRTTVRPLV